MTVRSLKSTCLLFSKREQETAIRSN